VKLLKLLIDKVLTRIRESEGLNGSHNTTKKALSVPLEAYFELLSAHKELIELVESNQEKLMLVTQAFKFIEKADYRVNLDFLKWIVSYSWNQGV
jgi:hypothetical protein